MRLYNLNRNHEELRWPVGLFELAEARTACKNLILFLTVNKNQTIMC